MKNGKALGVIQNETVVGERTISQNGSTQMRFARTNLNAPDLTTAAGEEVFTVTALAGADVTRTILDSARLQIWPIAQASIGNVDPNMVYKNVPTIRIKMRDLYPDSTTYLRIYQKGKSGSVSSLAKIYESVVVIDDTVSHNRQLTLKNLDSYFPKDGTYQMEVLHETPFGIDLLAQSQITLDYVLNVRGSIYTIESSE